MRTMLHTLNTHHGRTDSTLRNRTLTHRENRRHYEQQDPLTHGRKEAHYAQQDPHPWENGTHYAPHYPSPHGRMAHTLRSMPYTPMGEWPTLCADGVHPWENGPHSAQTVYTHLRKGHLSAQTVYTHLRRDTSLRRRCTPT